MIKTMNLKANEETVINVVGGTHVKIKNLGDSTVYVSKHRGIVAGADNVKSVQGNTTDILVDVATYSSKENTLDYYGTIYALAESDCSIELETTNNSNFSCKTRGGGSASTVLDDVLKSGATYQLGVLTSDITLNLPESSNNDIEVDFAVADTAYSINCDHLSLIPVANTYYQVLFCYDKVLQTWFSSVVSNNYISTTTAEVLTDETN